LLNCYAKLKDIEKLDNFIKSPGELKFDLDTAITMCRQGGYYEQAAYLATKHGETDLVVDILIEDSKEYQAALDFIWHQNPEVVRVLAKFQTTMLTVAGLLVSQEIRSGSHRALSERSDQDLYRLLYWKLPAKASRCAGRYDINAC